MYSTQLAPTTTHNINGNLATHTNISLTSNDVATLAKSTATKSRPVANSTVVAGPSSGPQPVNKTLAKTKDESRAPPLPPRKASPGVGDTGTNKKGPNNNDEVSRSAENITMLCDLEVVPKTSAPPVPKHRVEYVLASDLILTTISPSPPVAVATVAPPTYEDNEVETIIVGPAETITGIIDTRPLEARTMVKPPENTEKNNVYQMKATPPSPSLHVRHQSMTTSSVKTPEVVHRPKPPAELPAALPIVVAAKAQLPQRPTSTPPQQSSFVYENMTITDNEAGGGGAATEVAQDFKSMPYENINLEYIGRLMSEGYSKEHVITALGISRNNIDMALDMLHVFVRKGAGGSSSSSGAVG